MRRTGIKRGLVTGVVFHSDRHFDSVPAATIPAIVKPDQHVYHQFGTRTMEQAAAFQTPRLKFRDIYVYDSRGAIRLSINDLDGLIRLVRTAGTQSLVLLRDVASATSEYVVWVNVFVLFDAFWMARTTANI